ncbi:primosomal protein N' [Oceanicella actignis]|uniref:Replication restart protein PriA n=1 Tax=Oceanicella actignis TaxID=1189325 RepID=A0A1M7SVI1_9RHOB|nr:primosomal protein N' [Oceanicella actignis]SES72409.1 replication restart DNA helicase PriA [Oceanicella actignis]SHN62396.1 replication restart DNA helicase PriA [Oceanicella actignis]
MGAARPAKAGARGEAAPDEDAFFPEGAPLSALPALPVDKPLDYLAPPGGVRAGDWVEAPIGPRRALALVWGPPSAELPPDRLKPLARRLDLPPMTPETRRFLARAADYTLIELGQVLRLASRAPGLREAPRMRRLLTLGPERPERMTPARRRVIAFLEAHDGMPFEPAELARQAGVGPGVVKGLEAAGALSARLAPHDPPFARLDPAFAPPALSPAQDEAAEALRQSVAARGYATFLLKGVTGSGKTEVYMEAVAECLRQGRQALVLLPEIALTAAFLDRFERRFGARPAEWHSAAGDAGRRRCWRAAASGQAQVVVGARSAVFLPFRDLGLVVVDEEHDGSYKQEDGPRYNARDMAVLRAALGRATAVLASATPALETWANARAGKYRRLDLPERFGPAVMPRMQAVDMRRHAPPRGEWISEPLARAVNERLARGEQSLLFINRRGYAPLTLCRGCGAHMGCPHCDAWLVEHRLRGRLVCHQCGHSRPVPKACPECGRADALAALGPGVERLAEEARARFPKARTALLSSDLAQSAEQLKARIAAIAAGEADVIIGTQLVAKGHNFPLLTLVGVIDADLGLKGGDLRAAEKTFQLLRQVAGRAGRADRPGAALLQTYAPDHPVIRAILSGDEETFWEREAAQREAAGAPPFGRMAGVIVSGPDEARVWRTAEALARAGAALEQAGAQLFGPAPAPIARIRGRFRVRLLVKAPRGAPLQAALRAWRAATRPEPGVSVVIDIDPQSFL